MAFFPGLGPLPGLNALTTLQPRPTYSGAVTEPLIWTVATPLPRSSAYLIGIPRARLVAVITPRRDPG